MTCVVYGLCSSRDGELRYIGQTTRSANRRLTQHLYYARGRKTAVHHWIMRERDDGFSIELRVLVADAIFNQTEQQVIADLRANGARLLNHTDGGGGVLGHVPTEETRRRKSELARAYWAKQTHRVRWRPSEEQKQKISAANKGNKSRTGQKHDQESLRKMREWAANNKERLSEMRRKYWERKRAQASS